MRTKFKPWTEPYLKEHQEVQLPLEELSKLDDYHLEIGSGKGQFLLEMSKKFPQETFVGVERNMTCSGFTAKKLVDEKIENGKLIFANVDDVFKYIKDKSVRTIFLNFSDPWPKKRHSKRRLTSEHFLSNYIRILKDDGKLVFKTDNKDLFDYSLEIIENSPFEIIERNDNYMDEDEFDTPTEYEMSFREKGQNIYRVVLKKRL